MKRITAVLLPLTLAFILATMLYGALGNRIVAAIIGVVLFFCLAETHKTIATHAASTASEAVPNAKQ